MGANSVDINNYPLLDEFTVEADSWETKPKQVCYIGGLTRVRGQEIVEAIALAKGDPKLVIAGAFQKWTLNNESCLKLIMLKFFQGMA